MLDESCLADNIEITPLDRSHDRGGFCCGLTPITNFFRNNARKDHELYKVRVFVACEKGKKSALGFYSLTLKTYVPEDIGDNVQKFERVGSVPSIYLAMLGVSEHIQGRGVGKLLMADAFQRTLEIAEQVGVYALSLDADNDRVVAYYEKLGFSKFESEGRLMLIPLSSIRDALAD